MPSRENTLKKPKKQTSNGHGKKLEEESSSMGSQEDTPPTPPPEEMSSLAARRARLRGSLNRPFQDQESAPVAKDEPIDVPVIPDNKADSGVIETPVLPGASTMSEQGAQVMLNLLGSMDQAMTNCATNLASLQKLAGEQSAVLKELTGWLHGQVLSEIGLNLNSFSESLSAALEPMRAAGELIPTIDHLVSTLENKGVSHGTITADELVANLADQLSAGTLDPWTFKCAYMAVFPADHPADLLRRLVELLGTQRLDGELFRAAYEAIQATTPPSTHRTPAAPVARGAEDQEELDTLRNTNQELERILQEREQEFEQLLVRKDQELKEAHQELIERHEALNTTFKHKETEYQALLRNQESKLTEKDSELSLLRSQMEELRKETQTMMKDLQTQMAGGVKAAAKAADTGASGQQPAQAGGAPALPAAKPKAAVPTPPPAQAPIPATAPVPPAQVTPTRPAVTAAPAPVRPAVPPAAPAPTGAGSYGSGVRAQVFEVIVRQALAGAPWREICAGPMQVNNITAEEVEAEVKRRQSMLGGS